MSALNTMYAAQPNSPYTTTLGEISATDTAVLLADASVLPQELPFLLTLGYDKSASETVLVTAVSGNTLTIARGVDGNALLWVAGTKAARIFTAKDLNDVQANIRALNEGKQENLTFDDTPTADSTNPVTSGGVLAALNLKANSAALAAHIGNTDNPHSVTAAQAGAATPAAVATAIEDVVTIGDMKNSAAPQSANWLPCDGRGIYSTDYPELVPLLQTANPTGKGLNIPSEIFALPVYKNAKGVACYNGRWAIACCGYNGNSSTTTYTPVLYFADNLYGDWTEIRLSTETYSLSGVVYNTKWRRWVAYGYKYVSNTECYPYIFYSAYNGNIAGTWTGYQVSNTCCKINTGCYANDQLVLMGKGCADGYTDQAYAFVAGASISFTENNFASGLSYTQGMRHLRYGDGYWAFVDNYLSVWYATDPLGTWTSNTVYPSGVQLRGLCYGNGVWCPVGMQNSGGYGRIFYSNDITSSFTNLGVVHNRSIEDALFSDGVFVATGGEFSSCGTILVSANGSAWTKKTLVTSYAGLYDMAANAGMWVMCGLHGATVLRHPEADAVLPELTPEVGTAYIKVL